MQAQVLLVFVSALVLVLLGWQVVAARPPKLATVR